MPGIPSVPITNDVRGFRAMLKSKIPPIRFIIRIAIAPNIQLYTNFITAFIGPAKILPKKNKNIIPII